MVINSSVVLKTMKRANLLASASRGGELQAYTLRTAIKSRISGSTTRWFLPVQVFRQKVKPRISRRTRSSAILDAVEFEFAGGGQ